MSYIEKEKLIKADIDSIENRVRHAFNQGYDLGYKEGKANCSKIPTGSTTKNDLALLEKTYDDFCKCEGGEGWLKIDGKEYGTDVGYAIEGVDIFMEVFKRRLAELPSVTPQEPKTGHWILTDIEGYRVWHCNCSECNKDPLDFVGGSENWWLIKSKLPKFCPNCGSRNEVEE